MKQQFSNPNSADLSSRCRHYTVEGRRCRLRVLDARSGLCFRHLSLAEVHRAEPEDSDNVYAPLIRNSQGLQTAQGINYSLSNLYELLAKGRISTRRAAVLAYINSLLLRTLPAIDSDVEAGITDPTAPPELDLTVTAEATEDTTEGAIQATAQTGSDTETTRIASAVTDSWDPSIPEPDPKRKPS